MLQISLSPNDYFTINGDIVVCLARFLSGNRCNFAISADPGIRIERGSVREKNGYKRPQCIEKPLHKPQRYYSKKDTLFRWNETREDAINEMEKIADALEQAGKVEQADTIRMQIDCLLPEAWEDDE